ncbi:hypothetical protein BD770DRAFT_423973 [Pilaira anomala]|nr:hypothetical protein BD770DRAFT_423973 [Pilaira anomala]
MIYYILELFPHHHYFLCINEDDIKNNLKNFLKSHDVFSVGIKSLQSNVILIIEYIYSSISFRMNILYYPDTVVDNLKMPWITIDAKWKLNKSNADYLKTLNMFDICLVIGETVLDAMKALFTNSKTKQIGIQKKKSIKRQRIKKCTKQKDSSCNSLQE